MLYLSEKQISHLRDLQKSNYKGKRSGNASALIVAGLADSVIEMEKIMRVLTLEKRNEIIDSATPIALDVYRRLVPVSKKIHYFSSLGEEKNKLGIGRTYSFGRIKLVRTYAYKITPGNLKRSIQVLSDILKKYKWKVGAIGPHYIKDRGEGVSLDSDQRYNGFYAHMVFGSAKAWRKRIVLKARDLAQIQVYKKMGDEARSQINSMSKTWWQ